ncbi:MAG: pectin acetylesterase-family hydrolase [Pseudomonadota bacterium]
MRSLSALPVLCGAFLVFTAPALGQPVTATATSPALDDPTTYCPVPLPPPTHRIWSGELPAWSGSGRPMIKVELGGDAVCNDGTPAAMFVRPAPATLPNGNPNPERDLYHIHLKGGGSCRGFSDCQERFCGTGGANLDKPGLMSSRGWADAVEGNGLFADRPRNRFAYANQVLVGYCSSDTWIGSAPAGTAVSTDPSLVHADEVAAVSRIAFMGEAIVNETLDTLDAGLTATVAGYDVAYRMPRLTRAGRLLVTGDSGGANGVRNHIDRIAVRYPEARVISALDAGGSIDMGDPLLDYTLLGFTDFATFMQTRLDQSRSFHSVADSALDASCLAAGVETECIDGWRLDSFHITTDLMQRTSLGDSQTVKSIARLVVPPTDPALETRNLAAAGLAAAAASNPALSVLGANCPRHVTFRNNRQVRQMQTFATGRVLYRELRGWVESCFADACTKIVQIAPVTNPTVSTCP